MATVTTSYTVNQGAVEQILTGPAMTKHLTGLGRDIAAAIRSEAPKATGALANDVGFEVVNQGSRQISLRVGQTAALRIPVLQGAMFNRALFVIYGHNDIYPVRAKVLRFPVRGGGVVFTKHVRAVPPNDYLTRGLRRVMGSRVGSGRAPVQRLP